MAKSPLATSSTQTVRIAVVAESVVDSVEFTFQCDLILAERQQTRLQWLGLTQSRFRIATAMLLEERIARGESLFIVGDRPPASGNGRTLDIPFLGREAPFPIGPLFLAHLLKCPVYLFFCVQEGRGYRIHMEPFAERVDLPRKGREDALRAWLERYALAVEARCRETPFQWFNFYDFWGEARSLPPPPPTAPPA